MEPSPTWMYSLLIRLSSGAFLFIALGLIAASTLVFLLNIESLMTNGGHGFVDRDNRSGSDAPVGGPRYVRR